MITFSTFRIETLDFSRDFAVVFDFDFVYVTGLVYVAYFVRKLPNVVVVFRVRTRDSLGDCDLVRKGDPFFTMNG